MATPTFPTTLPGVQMSTYGFKPVDGAVRTDMEGGPARVRQRYSATPTEFDVTWTFTRAQLAIFEKFFQVDLAGGALWFNMDLVNGMGKTTYVARFKGPFDAKTNAREYSWTVTATLETLARPYLP